MIGYLTGNFIDTIDPYVLIDVGGVGYAVYVLETWRAKAQVGNSYSLYVSTQVREESIELYGFATSQEKRFFELMLSVSGVGPKTALAIVNYGAHEVEQAISTANVEFFTAIPRIGKKNAQKIIIELKNKVGGLIDLDLNEPTGQKQEIIEAMATMGFSRNDVQTYVRDHLDETKTLEQNLKQALQYFGKRK